MMERIPGYLVVFLAIVLAGCTALPSQDTQQDQQIQITERDGLSLTFTTTQRTFNADEDVALELGVKNTGQHDARILSRQLFGPTFLVDCGSPSGGQTSLGGVVRTAQIEGEQTRFLWRCSHGLDLSGGREESFDAGVTVRYRYGTTASTDVALVPQDEFGSAAATRTDNTAAPVHADITVSSPIPVTGEERTVSLPVTVRNVGDGTVDGPVTISVTVPNAPRGVSITRCGGETGFPIQRDLFDGEREIVCQLSLDPGDIAAETSFTIRADMDYRYEEERNTRFTVRSLS